MVTVRKVLTRTRLKTTKGIDISIRSRETTGVGSGMESLLRGISLGSHCDGPSWKTLLPLPEMKVTGYLIGDRYTSVTYGLYADQVTS